jgi:hypothetical protein
MRKVRWLLPAFAVAIGALVFLGVRPDPDGRAREEDGKARKVPNTISFAAETTVQATPIVSAAAPGFDSERVWSGFDDWEPAVAVDPINPNFVYQLTTRYDGPTPCRNCAPNIIFRKSTDGGATWGPDSFLLVTRKAQNDPQIEVATSGHVYAAFLSAFNPGVSFTRSLDRGATWSAPLTFAGKGKKPNWSDKPWLIISADGQHVYIGFNSSDSYVVSSHDSGASFTAALKTNNDSRYWFHTGGAVSLSDPNVAWFAVADYSQTYAGDANINVLKTTDGGASWTTIRVDTSREMPDCPWAEGCFFGFFGPSPVMAVDAAGRLMIAYNAGDLAGGPQKMWVRTSTDGGATWSARQEMSNGSATVNNAFPGLVAAPGAGDFRLIWQDDRNASQVGWNTWYRRTTNGGGIWSAPVQLSDLTSGAPYKNANGYRFPYGDYLELAVDSGGRNHFIWGEGDSYTGPGGTWYTRGQ